MKEKSFPIHESAAKGFQKAPEVYETSWPDFSLQTIDFLVEQLKISPETVVLDLAAGVGKLTRHLVPLGCSLKAVEPVEGMRKKFKSLLADVPVLAGTAEAIPLEPQSVDVVLVATAFHWFDGEKALAEIHRVLKPGGRLGLLWNVREENEPWVGGMMAIVDRFAGDAPRYKTFAWKKAFDQTHLFTPLLKAQFPFVQKGTVGTVLDRIRSVSFISALEAKKQEAVVVEVRRFLEKHPGTPKKVEWEIPYRTEIYWCLKK